MRQFTVSIRNQILLESSQQNNASSQFYLEKLIKVNFLDLGQSY